MPRQIQTLAAEFRALLNRRASAAYLGVSVWTVDRLVRAGHLKPLQLTRGGKLMFRVRDLNAFVEKRAATRKPRQPLRGALRQRQEAANA